MSRSGSPQTPHVQRQATAAAPRARGRQRGRTSAVTAHVTHCSPPPPIAQVLQTPFMPGAAAPSKRPPRRPPPRQKRAPVDALPPLAARPPLWRRAARRHRPAARQAAFIRRCAARDRPASSEYSGFVSRCSAAVAIQWQSSGNQVALTCGSTRRCTSRTKSYAAPGFMIGNVP